MKKPKCTYIRKTKAYDYDDVIEYIEKKHKINVRDFAGKFKKLKTKKFIETFPPKEKGEVPYLDFWHWLIDNQFHDIHSGSYQYLQVQPMSEYDEKHWEEQPKWVNAILELINEEFPEANGELTVWVEW